MQMSPEEIENQLAEHRAAFAAIGHPLTDEQMALTERLIRGEITREQAQTTIAMKLGRVRIVQGLPYPRLTRRSSS